MLLSASLYRAGASLAAPALQAALRRRAARGKEVEARLAERQGVEAGTRPEGRLLWLHAASVGETMSLLPVIARLPETVSTLLTTGTVTSAQLADRHFGTGGGRVIHRFAPLDVPRWVARFLDHWRPDAAAFVESEIWPNTLAALRDRNVPLALINARLSPTSARRWALAPSLARTLFGGFAIVTAQSAADAERLRALGAAPVALGNLKDCADPLPADEAELARLGAALGGAPRWLFASTHDGEEAIAARVHAGLLGVHPGLVTIVAPRHPERGAAIARALGDPPRRSQSALPVPGRLWIADTLGELGLLYRLAPIVAIGKSFAARGGQNPLEPARLGCAIGCGPHMENFAEACARLAAAGGLTRLPDEAALGAWVGARLADPALARAEGERAHRAADQNADLPARTAALLAGLAGA